ncbi:MAG: NACHT domain-containing protein [Oscillatoriophycideae cyanobacterium NC_groundwater_1537_Pr4_S-0.65um_50_18]|nr:NACHT domain-containing protein [Oscillatoriophycideae cyanobacterium NC_groundwater_1537_Pr4_S-0.65um_50_18]
MTMEPFVDPIAGGLVGIVVDIAKKVGGTVAQSVSDRRQAAAALKKYEEKYRSRYGRLKLLGMQQAVELEQIYTYVRFLDSLSIRQFASLASLEETYREGQRRRFQTQESSKLGGAVVANEQQYLMVLGAPGAGKSTYLRRVGLAALQGKTGNYGHECIPVFLELKRFNQTQVDLKKAIAEEFQHFGFPESGQFAAKALEQGKLLILLDGLDEVPKATLNAVMEAIQNFVTQYEQNRFIASCRLAAYRSTFTKFRDIELADFDDAQIQQFICNWFQSDLDKQAKTAEKCWEILNEAGNKAAKELAHTPLLLTFLCLVYDRTQGFPSKRATLYRKALDILLEEWAAEKRITPGEIYQGLNTDLEKVLLSEIAYQGFVNDQLFFRQEDLVAQIKAFLADTVDKPKYLDGKAVLDAIAVQQGILVERAEDIFSFSHLTLQEYLVAQYIVQEDKIQELAEYHLTEQRWREVFFLVSGSMRNADRLLEAMEKTAQSYINTLKLKALLAWADKATEGSEGEYKPAAKRVGAIVLARVLNRDRDHRLSLALVFNRALNRDRDLDYSLVLALDLDLSLVPTRVLDFFFDLTHEYHKIKILQSVNFKTLMARLKTLKAEVPDRAQPYPVRQAFVNRILQLWFEAINLDPELVKLSEEELTALQNYFYANELMVRCKEAAVRVSEKTWAGIEDRMLKSPL